MAKHITQAPEFRCNRCHSDIESAYEYIEANYPWPVGIMLSPCGGEMAVFYSHELYSSHLQITGDGWSRVDLEKL